MEGKRVLDYPELVDRIGGDEEFARELLSEFVSSLPNEIEELGAILQSGDFEGIVLKAHTLKGSAANLSAKGLSEAAKVIEQAGRERDLGTARAGAPTLAAEAEKLKEEFAALSAA